MIGLFIKEHTLFLKSFRESSTISLANSLAISSEYGFTTSSLVFLSHITRDALKIDDVVYSVIYDVHGITLASSIISNRKLERYILATPVEASTIQALKKHKFLKKANRIQNVGEVMDIVVPVISYDYDSGITTSYNTKENIIGILRIGVSLEKIKHQIKNMTGSIIVLTVMIIVAGILISFFLVRLITRPIEKLTKGTRKIAEGNLKYRVSLNSNDEFGELASAFNSMAGDMEAHIRELNKEKKELLELKIAFEHRSQELEETLETNQKIQQDLIKSEKFATIGRLASSVAHELRNPLAAIKNISYFLSKMEPFKDNKSKNMVQMLSSEVLRANKIIVELLDYSRVKKLTKLTINIESFIDKVTKMVSFPDNIKLTKKIENFNIELDPDKITQVIINLISNARDAMPPSGGEIIISAKKTDKMGQIFIQDNACGMSQDTVAHIFEPLFTTKLQGIGLGLPIVKEIIEVHQGKISVTSKENVGTTFTIELPLK